MSAEHLPMTATPAQTQVLSPKAIFRLTAVFMRTMFLMLTLQMTARLSAF